MKHYNSKKLNTKNHRPTTNSGFGVLEAIISSAIITVFAAGVVVLGNISLRSVVINKHKLQAAYLAQEASEQIRNIRDTNWIDGDPTTNWDKGIDATSSAHTEREGGKFKLVPESEDISIIENSLPFTRQVQITKSPSGGPMQQKTAEITITVSWRDYDKPFSEIINTTLTDWMIN